jgi:hypothetical protein
MSIIRAYCGLTSSVVTPVFRLFLPIAVPAVNLPEGAQLTTSLVGRSVQTRSSLKAKLHRYAFDFVLERFPATHLEKPSGFPPAPVKEVSKSQSRIALQ